MGNGDKQADLAGPGVSTYEEVAKILPDDYEPLQSPMERMEALFSIKDYIEKNLCKELNLQMVQVPLIVDLETHSGPGRPGRHQVEAYGLEAIRMQGRRRYLH